MPRRLGFYLNLQKVYLLHNDKLINMCTIIPVITNTCSVCKMNIKYYKFTFMSSVRSLLEYSCAYMKHTSHEYAYSLLLIVHFIEFHKKFNNM